MLTDGNIEVLLMGFQREIHIYLGKNTKVGYCFFHSTGSYGKLFFSFRKSKSKLYFPASYSVCLFLLVHLELNLIVFYSIRQKHVNRQSQLFNKMLSINDLNLAIVNVINHMSIRYIFFKHLSLLRYNVFLMFFCSSKKNPKASKLVQN